MTKMHLNKELLKSNKKVIFFMLILVTILAVANSFLYRINPATARLEDEKNNIKQLVINEIMTSNKGVYNDPEGNSFDWLELYNGSDEIIDLTNYGLSDKNSGEVKWIFPSVKINAKSYLVIYLADETREGLYTNFSLKAEGNELITLKDKNSNVIDSVRTVATSKNTSMFRNASGEWLETEEITPGYENSEQGRNEFLENFKSLEAPSPIELSEFLPGNKGNVIFENNKLYSYIEVTNISESPVNLSEYYLSNDIKTPFKWRFPDIVLEPNTSYLVYANDLDKDNNANFRLKHKTGTVILSNKTNIIEQVNYEELSNGIAYIKENNKWHLASNISPGYPNTTQGQIDYANNIDYMKQDIVINEVMSSNNHYLPQNGNQYYDWIELYNNTDQDINLKDYSLTTDYDDNKMYQLPEIILQSHNYVIFMASGDTKLSNNSYAHTNFKLSSSTGLYLFKNQEIIDSLFIFSIPKGNSYGRGTSGHYYYQNPTPGWANDSNGLRQISYQPTFDQEAGIYNNISSLEVKIEGAGQIFYTTDGTTPNENSIPYNGPITLTKTTTIRAVSFEDNKKNSEIITNSYIINENHTVPVMSITLNRIDFNRISSYTYGHNTIKAHAELFEDNSSFSLDCGFKLFGGQSRELPKKSFALKFNSEYTGTQLHYKVFDNKDIYEFNTLVLRSGSQEQENTLFKDEIVSTMLINYGKVDAQAAKPIVLYINGEYWGVYFIREKIDDDFIEKNYNVTGGNTNIVDSVNRANAGSTYNHNNVLNYARTHNFSTEDAYNSLNQKIDIDNFLHYWATQLYINNSDIHNIRYFNNSKIDNGRIKMILYDTDYSFRLGVSNYINYIRDPQIPTTKPDTTLTNAIFGSPLTKDRFLRIVGYNIKNVWTEEHVNQTYYQFYNAIKDEMPRESRRWGRSYDNWLKTSEELRERMINRKYGTINYLKSFYNLSEEEVNEYFQ